MSKCPGSWPPDAGILGREILCPGRKPGVDRTETESA
jgi:hypothetical protein